MTAGNAFTRSLLLSGIIGLLAASPLWAAIEYGGRGLSIGATVTGLPPVAINDTGPLPSNGGSIKTTLLEVNALHGAVRTENVSASTSGANEISHADAFVSRGTVTVGGYVITWDAVSAWALAVCCQHDYGKPEISGKAQILNLKINGVTVDANSRPNETIPLVGGRIILNEQDTYLGVTEGRITVNAIHIILDGVADVVVSSAHARIVCDVAL